MAEDTDSHGWCACRYSHAIGDHGHAAGPTIGLHEMQNQPVPGKGDVGTLRSEMWYLAPGNKSL